MSGTLEGGKKAAKTNKERYGKDFYAHIGQMGGRNGHTGGFSDIENAKDAGAKGGRRSRRGYQLVGETETELIYINRETHEEERVTKVD